jgi:hypothetical protein
MTLYSDFMGLYERREKEHLLETKVNGQKKAFEAKATKTICWNQLDLSNRMADVVCHWR